MPCRPPPRADVSTRDLGLPFPLHLCAEDVRNRRGLPQYLARRARDQARRESYVADAVVALNTLAVARGDGSLEVQAAHRITADECMSVTNDLALRRIGSALSGAWPPPYEKDLCPRGAFCELLRSRTLYDASPGMESVVYEASILRILDGGVSQRPLCEVVGDQAKRFLAQPEKFIELPCDDVDSTPAPDPYWDPTLAGSRKLRRDFILRLNKVGLVSGRRRAKGRVAIFFVHKKGNMLRLVVDCRATNRLHRRPPHSFLATPCALSQLVRSDEWARLSAQLETLGLGIEDLTRLADDSQDFRGDAADFPQADGEVDAHAAGIDLVDAFFQFSAEEVASWFCLDEVFSASELGVEEIFNEDTRCMEPVDPDTPLWACLSALCAGWSHALYFCHDALSEASLEACRRIGLPPRLIGDRQPTALFTRSTAYIAPYVDNGNVLGGSKDSTDRLLVSLADVLHSLGFVTHERTRAVISYDIV